MLVYFSCLLFALVSLVMVSVLVLAWACVCWMAAAACSKLGRGAEIHVVAQHAVDWLKRTWWG
jgi:hypothetical protein